MVFYDTFHITHSFIQLSVQRFYGQIFSVKLCHFGLQVFQVILELFYQFGQFGVCSAAAIVYGFPYFFYLSIIIVYQLIDTLVKLVIAGVQLLNRILQFAYRIGDAFQLCIDFIDFTIHFIL